MATNKIVKLTKSTMKWIVALAFLALLSTAIITGVTVAAFSN